MRAELPAGNGVGAAFWLLPVDGSWPTELDVMESLGQDSSTVYQTVHGGTSSAPAAQQQVAAHVAGGAASGFHTYGVDWEADKTTFYVDGKQTGQFDTPASMHKPMYMILSDNSTPASDVKWGKPVDGSTPFPADFRVDYVRAYASVPDLSSGGSPAPGGAAASATVSGSASTGPDGTGASVSASGSAASNAPAPSTASAPPVVGSGADTLVLDLSEDAYGGDAQFTLTVDGKAVGSAQAVTAAHGKGQSEAFTFKGDWSGPHVVGVSFTNDRYDGTAATDRNLYIDGATFDGAAVEGKTPLYGNGTASFAIGSAVASAASAGTLSVTDSTGGSASLPLIAAGSRTDSVAGGGTISQAVKDGTDTLTTSGVVESEAAALGGGTQKLVLINPRAMTVTGGSGAGTVSADGGSNRYVAGPGSLDVTGGPGASAYVLHAGAGSLTVEDFDAGKGDTLSVDKTLQGSLKQVSDGHGGTLLGFGSGTGTVDLISHAALDQSSIRFV